MVEKGGHPGDYAFRYRLDSDDGDGARYPDPLVEMVRAQLENILNVALPLSGGREVLVDGFKLLRDRDTVYRIFPRREGRDDLPGAGTGPGDRGGDVP